MRGRKKKCPTCGANMEVSINGSVWWCPVVACPQRVIFRKNV